jgi:Aminotransferase class-III
MNAIDLEARYCAHNYEPIPVVLSRGQGAHVWDTAGRRYVDMMSAYSAASHGHAHSRILAALEAQAGRLAVPSRAFYNDRLGPFLAELCRLTSLDAALPMNTGAEAVETAIKAARRWGYRVKGVAKDRANIIVADGNFHGRTTTIVSFSSEADYRDGFGPFTPGFRSVPFGDLAAVERAITPDTVAVLMEPIQGEAGIIIPPPGFSRGFAACATRITCSLSSMRCSRGSDAPVHGSPSNMKTPDPMGSSSARPSAGGCCRSQPSSRPTRSWMSSRRAPTARRSAEIRSPRRSGLKPFRCCARSDWWSGVATSAPI